MALVNSQRASQSISPLGLIEGSASSTEESQNFDEILVGRSSEFELLRHGVVRALQRRGRFFTITGEAGIGKTLLAGKLAEVSASLGAWVLWGRCWEGGGAPEYWPWIQIIRALVAKASSNAALQGEPSTGQTERLLRTMDGAPVAVSELADGAGFPTEKANRDRFRLFDALANFIEFAANINPLLLILDDLHAADYASLSFLLFLTRRLRNHPLVLVTTYRESELKSHKVLETLTIDIEREAEKLPLTGLSEPEVGVLAERFQGRAVPGDVVAAIHRITGGNPFFIGEFLKSLTIETGSVSLATASENLRIPNSVYHAIERGLEPISPACREVLAIASVIGQEIPVQLLRLIHGNFREVDEAIAEARSAGILVNVLGLENSLRFRHALLREALYHELAPTRRVELHQRIGDLLESAKETSVVKLSELAYHFSEALRGGNPVHEKVIEYSSLAGSNSLNALAYEESAIHYRRAVEAASSMDPQGERCASLTLSWGRALAKAQDPDLAKQAFWAALKTAKSIKAPVLQGEAVLEIAGQWPASVPDGELVSMIEEAVAILGNSDVPIRARLLSRLAVEFYWSNRREVMLNLSQQAVELATRLGDPAALVYTLLHRRFALTGPDHLDEQPGIVSQIRELARHGANRDLYLETTFWNLAHVLQRGDVSAVDLELATVAPMVKEARLPRFTWYKALLEATRALQSGRFEEGERLAAEARSAGNEAEPSLAALYYWSHLLLIRREQNRLVELEDSARALVYQLPWSVPVRCDLIFVMSQIGKRPEVFSELETLASSGFTSVPRDALWFRAICFLAEACWTSGASEPATALYDLLLPFGWVNVCSGEGGACLGSAERYVGLLAAAKGDWDSAILHLERAIEANTRMGAFPWISRSYYDCASVRLIRAAQGDEEEAHRALGKAILFADSARMNHLKALAEELGGKGSSLAKRFLDRRLSSEADLGNIFRREGDLWTITYEGQTLALRDFKGLSYIARLLRNPGEEFPAVALAHEFGSASGTEDSEAPAELRAMTREQLAEGNLRVGGLEDAGEMLDAQAKADYGLRLKQLREELEEAKELRNTERIAKAEDEIEALSRELSRAVGRGGRDRRAGSASERARLSVTRAIWVAVERISQKHSRLAVHLSASIRTGTFCCYRPDPKSDIAWHF